MKFFAEQVIDGLDKAVKNMKKGETALVTIHPDYAFGTSETPQEMATVPANSSVYYEVELLSFVKVRIVFVNHICAFFHFFLVCVSVFSQLRWGVQTNTYRFIHAGEGILGNEHAGKDRNRWEEKGRRECTIQGWQISESLKEI